MRPHRLVGFEVVELGPAQPQARVMIIRADAELNTLYLSPWGCHFVVPLTEWLEMITHLEIDGFKTFENFSLDLQSFSAVVGPNASGKSNLFDALRFISLLAQTDVRSAMQDLRGEPEELFRRTPDGTSAVMRFAIEVLLNKTGADAFGTKYEIKSQRLRYELCLSMKFSDDGKIPVGIFVKTESCLSLSKSKDKHPISKKVSISYSGRKNPFINMSPDNERGTSAIEIRQDGPAESGISKRGRPIRLSAQEASRTALSTITTAEFPHLYALRDLLSSMRFLEINPSAARSASDRFELKSLRPDASNLAAVLAHLKQETSTKDRPEGVLSDISMDLASLIPSVRSVKVFSDTNAKEYSFGVSMADSLEFSSRVISDGTLRILALLTILDDPERRGILCFEEPENGVHEGRISSLVKLLRNASDPDNENSFFQVLVNTHSPAVMAALEDEEIVAADTVAYINPDTKKKFSKTRMRVGVQTDGLFRFDQDLTRKDIEILLRRRTGEA